jgi:hypothetical protein
MQKRSLLALGCGLIVIAIVGFVWWERGPTRPRDGSARERARAMAGLPVTAEVTAASVQAGLLRKLPLGTYEKDVVAYLAVYDIPEDQFYSAGMDEGSVQFSISISSLPSVDGTPIPVETGFGVSFRFEGDTRTPEDTQLVSLVVH